MRKPKVVKVRGWRQRPDGAWVPDKRTWPKVKQIVAVAAALILAACGGGSGGNDPGPPGLDLGPPPSGVVYVQAVPIGYWQDGRLGEYDQVGLDGYVRIREDALGNNLFATRILTHELGHALGFPHLAAPCVMDPNSQQIPNAVLCPQERDLVDAYAGPILVVYVGLTPNLLTLTGNAASIWNQEHGGSGVMQVQ